MSTLMEFRSSHDHQQIHPSGGRFVARERTLRNLRLQAAQAQEVQHPLSASKERAGLSPQVVSKLGLSQSASLRDRCEPSAMKHPPADENVLFPLQPETRQEIEARIAKLQAKKKVNPDNALVYSIQQTALEQIEWVLFGKEPPE
jgi:hypothetical protein